MGIFDNLTFEEARPLPVIILADASGSMAGNKIENLNIAIREMIDKLKNEESPRAEVFFSIITFGISGAQTVVDFSSVSKLEWPGIEAAGGTPMGEAFEKVAQLIEDKEIIPGRAYTPTIILLSDGQPTDRWEVGLDKLNKSQRASKATRMAMSIEAGDYGETVLRKFLGNNDIPLFETKDARDINKFFKFVTMSVTQRLKSVDPNAPTTLTMEGYDEIEKNGEQILDF